MKKKQYVSPATRVVQAYDSEGVICNSIRLNIHVYQLDNMNADEEALEEEEFYFKS